MRTRVRDTFIGPLPDEFHMGLAYQLAAPIDAMGAIPDAKKASWFDTLERWTAPADYRVFFDRWDRSMYGANGRSAICELASRLLVGHGETSPTEVGITLHHTWGVPVIPGTALKGLLSHYVDAVYGPDDNTQPDEDRARFAGPTLRGARAVTRPGEVHAALFGSPEIRDEDPAIGIEAAAGLITFHDALYAPPDREEKVQQPFARDVLTPHQAGYYRSYGESPPNDYDDPVPVSFLTVCPGARFLLALSGPPEWTEFALGLLIDALSEWGVGAKTSLGYGRITTRYEDRANPESALLGQSDLLRRLKAFLEDQSPLAETGQPRSQKLKLEILASEWIEELLAASPDERLKAAELVVETLKSRKVSKSASAFASRLEGLDQ